MEDRGEFHAIVNRASQPHRGGCHAHESQKRNHVATLGESLKSAKPGFGPHAGLVVPTEPNLAAFDTRRRALHRSWTREMEKQLQERQGRIAAMNHDSDRKSAVHGLLDS